MRNVDVVIPVYLGYDETVACLESVIATLEGDWARIVVINDRSPDQKIADYLRDLARQTDSLVLVENPENVGFVASANIGLGHDPERDVVLLNSDVEVAGNWLYRLRQAAYRHGNVASVTPFSNNATVCSFPDICEQNELLFGLSLAELDAQFGTEFSADDVFPVPTGVGCCMYMRRDCIDLIGLFDLKTFGRGYGEENDWCQRAARQGWLNLHLANCYVYHRGGVSFGDEYGRRLARALDILDKKYPRYHGDIQRFIAQDPARLTRVMAWLRMFAAQQKPKVLLICHKLGGGVQQHVDEVAGHLCGRALFLLLTPDKDGESVMVSCYDRDRRLRDGLFFDVRTEYRKLVELLRGLGIGRVHFHHTMGLPTRLWHLAQDLECAYDLTIHDYHFVNGNPSLTDRDGYFVAEDAADFDARCAGHRPLPPGVTAQAWRENQRTLVERAERVIFPSFDTYRRFSGFFRIDNPIVAWHPDSGALLPYPKPQWRYAGDRPLRVLVIGAMSKEKGADILDSVASATAGQGVEFHLLGYAYRRLGAAVIAHGPYDNCDVAGHIQRIDPDVVWFPALWPETYSYTLSLALRAGLPVVVPNLGAFPERIDGRPLSVVVQWNASTAERSDFWTRTARERALPGSVESFPLDLSPVGFDFYASEYLGDTAARSAELDSEFLRGLDRNLFAHSLKLSRSERLLKRIWYFSLRPLGSRLISMVPFRIQRTIKRSLSHRPMHDIVGKQR